MADEKRSAGKHSVVMDRRELVNITGVTDVISFDEETVIADTDLGAIILRGANLHVNKLNLDSGELEIDGDILSLNYEEQGSVGKGKSSFLNKIFK